MICISSIPNTGTFPAPGRGGKLYSRPGRRLAGWIRGDANDVDYRVDGDSNVNINYIDLRYAGWKPWAGSWTEFGIDYAMPNTTKTG